MAGYTKYTLEGSFCQRLTTKGFRCMLVIRTDCKGRVLESIMRDERGEFDD